MGIKHKDFLKILSAKSRETIFIDMVCRVAKNYVTECQVDIEEANAANVSND